MFFYTRLALLGGVTQHWPVRSRVLYHTLQWKYPQVSILLLQPETGKVSIMNVYSSVCLTRDILYSRFAPVMRIQNLHRNDFSKKRTLKMLKIRAYLLVNVPDLELYKAVVDSIDVASVVAERHSSCPFGVL